MRFTTEIECSGEIVVVEIDTNGDLVFHNHDIDSDKALEELGFETSECITFSKLFEKLPKKVLSQHFNLDGDVWFAILVAWTSDVSWPYKMAVSRGEKHGVDIPTDFLVALQLLEERARFGVLDPEDEAALENLREGLDDARKQFYLGMKKLEKHWVSGYSGIFAACEEFMRSVSSLSLFAEVGTEMLGMPGVTREALITAVINSRFSTAFLDRSVMASGGMTGPSFLDATSRVENEFDEMVAQAVGIAHGME